MINALARIFKLVGGDLDKWYRETKRPVARSLGVMGGAATFGHQIEHIDYIKSGYSREGAQPFARGGAGALGNASRASRTPLITSMFMQNACLLCGAQCAHGGNDIVCGTCASDKQRMYLMIARKMYIVDRERHRLLQTCGRCTRCPPGLDLFVPGPVPKHEFDVDCRSQACDVYYRRRTTMTRVANNEVINGFGVGGMDMWLWLLVVKVAERW